MKKEIGMNMLLFLLAAVVIATLSGGCGEDKKESARVPGTAPTAGAFKVQKGDAYLPAASGYVGSEACVACHPDNFRGWSNTIHNKPLKMLSELGASILVNDHNSNGTNDFVDGLDFNDPNFQTTYGYANPFAARVPNAPKLSASGGRYFITVGTTVYEVQRTQGGNGYWKQRYHTKIGNGYYVLPVQYNEVTKRYTDYNSAQWYSAGSTPFFTQTYSATALVEAVAAQMVTTANGPASSSWENRCAACHQTGMRVEFRDTSADYPDETAPIREVVSGYVELNIGCEACHGPGAAHVASGRSSDIINPDNFLALGRRGYYAANEVCGRCHQRSEGHVQFSDGGNTVQKFIESPSLFAMGSTTIAAFPAIGESILPYFDVAGFTAAATWDVKSTRTYDTSTTFPSYIASKQHHLQWFDMEQGRHGAEQQTLGSGLTCWSCHDMHSTEKPHNIRASINGVATDAHDNTLCLACHDGVGDFTTGLSQMDQVKNHLIQQGLGGKAFFITVDNYLQPVKAGGAGTARYGLNVYRLGECISCHMPYTAASASGLTTADTRPTAPDFVDEDNRNQGDIRNHSLKVFSLSSTPIILNVAGAPNSCSPCHGGGQ